MEEIKLHSSSQISNLPTKQAIISVIGAPGSGKGTLCKLLAKNHGMFHIATGELLREEAKSGSAFSKEIAQALKTGDNVKVEIILYMLKKVMRENTSHNGYLLDGFPRDARHGLKFEESVAPIDCVLFLEASIPTLKKRLMIRAETSNREDDSPKVIGIRIEKYKALEKGILKTYSSKIRKISCEQSIMEVYQNAIRILGEYLKPKKI